MHRLLLGLLGLGILWQTQAAAQSQTVSDKDVAIQNAATELRRLRPSALLTRRTRETFDEIRAACSGSSGVTDWTAVEWLLTTAQDHGWEGDLDALTQQLLSKPPESPGLLTQTRAVRIVGCARRGGSRRRDGRV